MKIIGLLLFSLTIHLATAQTNEIQSTPEAVMQEIFNAAKTKDYSKLHLLCPSDKSNDGDTQKYICDIASASEKGKQEYISYFKDANINGEIEYVTGPEGQEGAKVPFWFNCPSGGERCNETMDMMKMDGKWYLISF